MTRVLAVAGVFILMAGSATAGILEPCLATMMEAVPHHPGANERVGIRLRSTVAYPAGRSLLAHASVHNGLIDLDVVSTDTPDDFPGYRPLGDLYFDVADEVGPLAPGVYPINGVFRDVADGTTTVLCIPLPIRVAVGTSPGPVTERDAIEYFNAGRDRYFVTADAGEIAYLDAGGEPGWSRTGQGFRVYALDASDGRGRLVCRFVSPPQVGIDAHFLSAGALECGVLPSDPMWIAEGFVFELALPHSLTGACRERMIPIYRLWNPRSGDHRWTPDAATRASLVVQGWVPEGYGDLGVALCAPQA
jgi:hypothetical protein